ncbi:MAG: patatin-like phospholipase family protein [Myxococcota bacterium]
MAPASSDHQAATPDVAPRPRRALVLSGGGARGAYEAGVLAHVFEHVLPELGPQAAFDVVSGTSVGAIHAAFAAATADLPPAERARRLIDTWHSMRIDEVIQLDAADLLKIPLRALGFAKRKPRGKGLVGGLVDFSPLESLVGRAVPWESLHANLHERRPAVLCISCTEVRSGRVTIFMDGALADASPWQHDPNAQAISGPIGARHVRASAAIPFLFPSVRIGERFYVDGGLRMNTPLSPAVRLRSERILVIALKPKPVIDAEAPPYPEEVITQPAFLLGKVLDALTLDQIEYELQRIELINAMLAQGEEVYGPEFRERINPAVRRRRGVGFRPVETVTIRPSEDIGRIAARCYHASGGTRSLGVLPELLARAASSGVPADEADLLSYLYFDGRFTRELIEMGIADAREQENELAALLAV